MCLAAYYGGNAINKQLAGYAHAFAHLITRRQKRSAIRRLRACSMR